MAKFTTAQLKAALVELHKLNTESAFKAYRMTFAELHRRMGDDDFDAWCDEVGI